MRWRHGILGMTALLMVGCQQAMPPVQPLRQPVRALWGPATEQLARQLVLAVFDRADRNHDRFLGEGEWPGEDVQAWDKDGNGRLNTFEWAEAHPVPPLAERWRQAAGDYFRRLDVDQDDVLTRAEVAGLAALPVFKDAGGRIYDRLYERYASKRQGLTAPVFADFVLQLAIDAGRFAPILTPPAWPADTP